jgi:hypothetical protein
MEQAPGMTVGATAPGPGGAAAEPAGAEGNGQAVLRPGSPPGPSTGAWRAAAAARWPFQLLLLACYLAAGVAVTWPRASYLAGRLPGTLDQSSYVWDFWWIGHQVTHLGNPWFTPLMAAPAGTQLGFDTLMPLPGLLMTPVTLVFGPSASYNLLTIVTPGLSCYLAYRVARLWLSTPLGAICAGAFYGLATMLVWQDWYHLNIALGALFFPLALETAVRLQRRPGPRRAIILGVVLGLAFLVNQETAVMAAALAGAVLLVWLARTRSAVALWQSALAAGVAIMVAGPQIAAMAVQALSGGAALPAGLLAHQDTRYGVPLESMFAPSPRTGDFGLTGVASIFYYQTRKEGVPTFGVVLTLLAVAGLVVAWRRLSARLLGLAWLVTAVLAVGSVVRIGHARYVPLALASHGVSMSLLLPYTWLVHLPGLTGFREPDRFMLLGLLPAAVLAGMGVEWLRRQAPVLLAVALALAVLEAGFSGSPFIKTMRTAIPRLDAPIAADHSGSIVVDIPYGLGGGLGIYGAEVSPHALVQATADGHPRAVADVSWESATTVNDIKAHPFYRYLVAAEDREEGPARAEEGPTLTAAQLRAARQDALRMHVGWAIVWKPDGEAISYLRQVGFTYQYRVGKDRLFRLAPVVGAHRGRTA